MGIDSETHFVVVETLKSSQALALPAGRGPTDDLHEQRDLAPLTPLPDEIRHALETFGGGVTPKDSPSNGYA